MSLSTDAINSLISGINGLGIVNLGSIAPDFYLRLEAMEQNGILDIQSTPALATLNSHPASLRIGSQRWYRIVQNTVIPGLNNITQESVQWNSADANLEINISPIVSENEQVTLDIDVIQSEFADANVNQDAPPGSNSRAFQSMMRVRNGDMILLGGLERRSKTETVSGLPLIARIPILNWIFARKHREKRKSKLTVFIRPTISYN